MTREGSPDVVGEFLHAVGDAGVEVGNLVSGARDLSDVLKASRQGALPRSGRLPGGGTYQIHGAGCRFELVDGRAVDLDVGSGRGLARFDDWKFLAFVRSLARTVEPSVAVSQLHGVLGSEIREVRGGFEVAFGPGPTR